jgi:hypothetical protein
MGTRDEHERQTQERHDIPFEMQKGVEEVVSQKNHSTATDRRKVVSSVREMIPVIMSRQLVEVCDGAVAVGGGTEGATELEVYVEVSIAWEIDRFKHRLGKDDR